MAKRSLKNIVDDWGAPRLGNSLYIDNNIRLQSLIVLFETLKSEGYNRKFVESPQTIKAINVYCLGKSKNLKTREIIRRFIQKDLTLATSLVFGEAVVGVSRSAEENLEKNKKQIEIAQAQTKELMIAEEIGKQEAAKEIERARYKVYVPNPDLLKQIQETFGNVFSTEPGNGEDIL